MQSLLCWLMSERSLRLLYSAVRCIQLIVPSDIFAQHQQVTVLDSKHALSWVVIILGFAYFDA